MTGKQTGAQIGAKIATESLRGAIEEKDISSKEKLEGAKIGVKIAEDLLDKSSQKDSDAT